MKTLVAVLLSLVGLKLTVATPLIAYLYTFLLLVLGGKVFAPAERKVVNGINQLLTKEKWQPLFKKKTDVSTQAPVKENGNNSEQLENE